MRTTLDIPEALRDDQRDAAATRAAVADRVAARSAEELRALFAGQDVCCTIVAELQSAVRDPHFTDRGVFTRELAAAGRSIPALPVPVAENFRSADSTAGYPQLGEANDLLDNP